MLNRVMTKDNIAISALLQTKEGAFDPTNMPDSVHARQSIMVSTQLVVNTGPWRGGDTGDKVTGLWQALGGPGRTKSRALNGGL
jgi:hypothetical protein